MSKNKRKKGALGKGKAKACGMKESKKGENLQLLLLSDLLLETTVSVKPPRTD